jgi:hypothetical protein
MTKYLVTAKVEHKGYEVNYNERMDQWEVAIKDRTLYDPKLSEIKKKIDRITAPAKPDRLSVLHISGGRCAHATITSWEGNEARLTFDSGERGKGFVSYLYDDTHENKVVAVEIEKLATQRREIDSKVRVLEKKLTSAAVRAHNEKATKLARGEEVS